MQLSKNSKKIISFFNKHKHINYIKQTKKTTMIFNELYMDILNAYHYVLSLKESKNMYYTLQVKNIESSSHIKKPKFFNSNNFPEIVRKRIDEHSVCEYLYTFSLFEREIQVYFILEQEDEIETYNSYIDIIIMWLHILNQYSSKECAHTLIVYFYFTLLEKKLPPSNINILDEVNVNTAFTSTCPKDSEIVVFRKEEWLKVFIHETFHNFGLDFSDMNNEKLHHCVLDIFKVKSNVNLYESYTECWAEIMNASICSFVFLEDKYKKDEFIYNLEFLITLERTYSFFQLIKVLDFMGLTYEDLYSQSEHSRIVRENLYKEKSNVFSYYVVKTILMNNYQGFLLWCKLNNLSLLQFKKTISNQTEYCRFLEKNYKTKSMLQGIHYAETFFQSIHAKNVKNTKNTKNIQNTQKNMDILSNLRMSVCELS
jgi:hypothetical protein